jgi:hyperosmotically inducible protein
MKRILIISLLLAAGGCDRSSAKEPASKQEPQAQESPAANAAADNTKNVVDNAKNTNDTKNAAADNTEKNERDRNPSALTPGDQGSSETDRTISQQIRQSVVKDDALSMTGKNVKIITVGGVVTLRGPVKTSSEKSTIAGIAQNVQGVKRVDNQLEVAVN